jgi:biopolymer transport protein ExbD
MSMSTGTNGRIAPDLNVTPFIDILLVLLIIFIVIATSLGSKGEQALIPQPAPQGAPPPPPDARTVIIRLVPAADGAGADGRPQLFINKEPVTWEALHDRLFAIYAARVERVAFIQAEKNVTFQYVADVIDTAHKLDIDKVGLIQPNAAVAEE